MGYSGGKWYEREEIKRVTLDWVKTNCKFTERENELLQLVYDRKLVKRDHLEIISKSYRNLGENRTRLMNRAIKKLYQSNCLDKVHEAKEKGKGNNPCTVAIDKGGSIILGVPHKKRITHRERIVKGSYYVTRILPSNFRHINGVNQMEVETILLCEEKGIDIVRWQHEVSKIFQFGQQIQIITDVVAELKARDKSLYLFLEYDTGSESRREKEPKVIHDKIENYRKYKISRMWEDEFPVFPILLLVTEDEKRIEFFNQKCKESGIRGYGVYYESYTRFLESILKISKLSE